MSSIAIVGIIVGIIIIAAVALTVSGYNPLFNDSNNADISKEISQMAAVMAKSQTTGVKARARWRDAVADTPIQLNIFAHSTKNMPELVGQVVQLTDFSMPKDTPNATAKEYATAINGIYGKVLSVSPNATGQASVMIVIEPERAAHFSNVFGKGLSHDKALLGKLNWIRK